MSGQSDYRRPERHSLGAFLYRGLEIIETGIPELPFSPKPMPQDANRLDPIVVASSALRSAVSRRVIKILPSDAPDTTIAEVTNWRMSAIELGMLPLRDRRNGPCLADYFNIPDRVIYAVYFRHALEEPKISEYALRKKVANYLNVGITNGRKGWGFKVGQIRSVTEARHPKNFTRAYRAFRHDLTLFEHLFTIHFQQTYDYVIALEVVYWHAMRTESYGKLSGIDLAEAIDWRENLLKIVTSVLDTKNRQAA